MGRVRDGLPGAGALVGGGTVDAALGSAFVARCVAGVEEAMTDGARWARTARTVEPEAAPADAAEERYRRFRARTSALLAG